MKKIIALAIVAISAICAAAQTQSAGNKPMEKTSDGTYIIDTSTLSSRVIGYNGTTPLKVYIKKDAVVKVEPLPNRESPGYFNTLLRKYIHSWDGVKVDKINDVKPDGYTGATYSAQAVEKNVKAAVEYYKENKK